MRDRSTCANATVENSAGTLAVRLLCDSRRYASCAGALLLSLLKSSGGREPVRRLRLMSMLYRLGSAASEAGTAPVREFKERSSC